MYMKIKGPRYKLVYKLNRNHLPKINPFQRKIFMLV